MNRQLKKREIALIFVLTFILLGLVYYQFIFKSLKDAEVQYDTTQIETEIQTETVKAADIARMKKEIADNKGKETGVVESYDNIKNEINALNDIFADAVNFNLSFDQPVADGSAVRRNIGVSFTASDYAAARKIIVALHDCRYRCLITDLSITPASLQNTYGSEGDINNGAVAVNLNVTFYETLYGASSTDGLQVPQDSSTDNSSLTNDLANDKERAESTGEDYNG